MINDIDEINVVIQDNDSISVNEGSVTDISEIVHNEEIRQANEAQRIINENERILNEGSREDYIADLKQQVEDGDFDGTDGISPVVTMEKQGKVTTLTITDATGTHTTEIRDGNDGSGTGDMLKATYDTNDNGVVDNAEKVNNHTVNSDVPANAVFTDTTYTAGTGIDITNGVISNTQTSAEWGNITGDIDDQLDLQSALSDKQDNITSTNKLDADLIDDTTSTNKFFSGDYEDLANKPTIPDELADLSSDSTHRTVTDAEKTTWSGKQDALVSGTNIKTINNTSILGSGDIEVGADIPQQDTAPSNPQEDDLWIDTDDDSNLVHIDSQVSTTSTNPIENQAITNYVDEKTLDVYSTNETKIGIWTTGKPLYRKVYKVENSAASYSLTPPANVDIYTKLRVMQLDGDGAFIPDYYLSSTDYLRIFKTGAGIQIRTSKADNSFTHWIVVEYTKKTN